MEITRQLRKDKLTKKGFAPIQITICWAGHRVRVFSGEKCRPEHWDADDSRVKAIKGSYYAQINPKLDAIQNAAELAQDAAEQQRRRLTEDELLAAVEAVLKPQEDAVAPPPAEPADERPEFFQLMSRWIEEYEQKVNPRTYRPIPPRTIEALRSTQHRFEQFAQATGQEPTLAGMNPEFYDAFRRYVLEDLGQELNTFGKHISRLRTFLTWCEEQDLAVNRRYRKFVAPSVYVGVDALTEAELRRLQALDFASAEVQQRLLELRGATHEKGNDAARWSFQQWAANVELARDKLLECVYTGLRISDADLLSWQHVKQDQLIHLRAGKNQHLCYIPFYDDELFHLVALARKYEARTGGTLLVPKCYRVNDFLKVVQELAGIKRLSLTTKIGRKTFVTLKLYQGVPQRLVMQATGHTTEKAFNHYVGVDTLKLLQEFVRKSPGLRRHVA
ncbi:hypothetical protein GCM10027048_19960 [Hymenobacter coalescens]